MAFIANGQETKVIQETADYILKECDSVFYFSHGIEPKDKGNNPSDVMYKENGIQDETEPSQYYLETSHGDLVPNKLIDSSISVINKTVFGYYVFDDSLRHWYNPAIEYIIQHNNIQRDTGQGHIICANPIYTIFLINGYNFEFVKNHIGGTFKIYHRYKNLFGRKHIKAISIEMVKEYPDGIKQFGSKSFLYYTRVWDIPNHKIISKKYYLVEIKQ